jgi:acyl carrier protein
MMTRDDLVARMLAVFSRHFEIENPDLDVDLREAHEFDSIDAIELLREIEILLESELTREEKKKAMDIGTINQIVDYVMDLAAARSAGTLCAANP